MAMTKRDLEAYKFVKEFKMVRLDHINAVAYKNYQVCANRMRQLAKDGILYKFQNKYQQGLLYTIDGRKNMKQYFHYMLRNDTYIKLLEVSDSINELRVEPTFGSVQSDMMIIGTYKGQKYFFLVECETIVNTKPINLDKYNHFFIKEYREFFDAKPTVLYVTDKLVDEEKITFKHTTCKLDFSNLIEVLEGAEKF